MDQTKVETVLMTTLW